MFASTRIKIATLLSLISITMFAVMPASAQTSACSQINSGTFNGDYNYSSANISGTFATGDTISISGTVYRFTIIEINGISVTYNPSSAQDISFSYTIPTDGTYTLSAVMVLASNVVATCSSPSAAAAASSIVDTPADSAPVPVAVDGRTNGFDAAAPVVAYPHSSEAFGNSLEVYSADGVSVLFITEAMVVDAGWDTTANTMIAVSADGNTHVSRLANGYLQIASLMSNGKTYIMLLDADTYNYVGSYEIEPAS